MFTNKTVLITGSSSGIGAETAVHFAKEGANVVLMARGRDGLEKTASRCKQEAGAGDKQILVAVGDVTKEGDIAEVVKKTIANFGSLNVLVNNAGVSKLASIDSTTAEDVNAMFRVNTLSAFFMCKEALPHLLESKGNIVNVSSVAGFRPAFYLLPYSMSKAALDQLTKCLALDLAARGIRVNSVNPGPTLTDALQVAGMVSSKAELHQQMENITSIIPQQRMATTTDVASAILWLASDQAAHITGVLLPVDGGRHATMRQSSFFISKAASQK